MGYLAAAGKVVSIISGAASAYSSVKTAEVATQGQQQQADMLKEQQKTQAQELKKQQEESLAKRKQSIDMQRKQMLGAGDTAYGINQTTDAGADTGSGSLLGVGLG
jgi:NADPH-dependent glutamate synthase beta subunit-like oxidoreductase